MGTRRERAGNEKAMKGNYFNRPKFEIRNSKFEIGSIGPKSVFATKRLRSSKGTFCLILFDLQRYIRDPCTFYNGYSIRLQSKKGVTMNF